jgi:type VI secretion system protein ImpA
LRDRSKDLQIAVWYTEACAKVHGFSGLAFGLQVLDGLVTDFWEFAYPPLDPEDLDERIGKIEWLNTQLTLVTKNIPLTNRASGGYPWIKWEESRQVENLGLKDSEAKQKATDAGKLSGEGFDRAVTASGLAFYESLYRQIQEAAGALAEFERHVDEKFGRDAPSLKDLRETLSGCGDLAQKLMAKLGGAATPLKEVQEQSGDEQMEMGEMPTVPQTAAQPLAVGNIRSRGDAINALRAVSRYFRANEPHSPVSLLAERAAKWAEMPIETWLSSVIKDESTLRELRELLDFRAGD